MDISTASIPAAALVVAHGYKLSRLEEAGRGRYSFVFNDEDGNVARLIVAYTNGAGAPKANEFYWALQDLRTAVNRVKNNYPGGGGK
jgi:hypothetical protein